jgi:predicted RND superfamily exporter protein
LTAQFNETRRWDKRSTALAVERFGLIPLRAPRCTIAVALTNAALAVLAALGMTVDDSLSQFFRSNSPKFRERQQVAKESPSSEDDVLAVVSGPGLLERQSLEKLRTLATDLQRIDGARGIVSMFSALAGDILILRPLITALMRIAEQGPRPAIRVHHQINGMQNEEDQRNG